MAIRREILEETGLATREEKFLFTYAHDWNLKDHVLRVHIHCFACSVGDGETRLEEQKAYQHRWVTKPEMMKMDLLAANKDILHKFFHETTPHMG